jgi:hypothetical protein
MVDDLSAWLGGLGPGGTALRLGAAIALSCLIGLDRELSRSGCAPTCWSPSAPRASA